MIFGFRIHEGVRNLVVAPVSHFAGTFLFALTALGSTHVLADGTDVLEIMKTIERERIEVVFLPPTLIYMMMSHPQVRDFDYSSLRAFVYAGAPMATAKVREAIEVFGHVMMNMFGQAEANGPIAFLLPEGTSAKRWTQYGSGGCRLSGDHHCCGRWKSWMTTAAFFLQACPVKLSFAVG